LVKYLRHEIKSKMISNSTVVLTIEVKVKRDDTEFMTELTTPKVVNSATLIDIMRPMLKEFYA